MSLRVLAPSPRRAAPGARPAFPELSVLQGFGRGGLVLGFYLGEECTGGGCDSAFQSAEAAPRANSLLAISVESAVTVFVSSAAFGAASTALLQATVAEALDVKPADVAVEFGNRQRRSSGPRLAPTVVAANLHRLRQAAGAARRMLLGAAAAVWSVREDDCTTGCGFVEHGASGRRAFYGELAVRASRSPLADAGIVSRLPRVDH